MLRTFNIRLPYRTIAVPATLLACTLLAHPATAQDSHLTAQRSASVPGDGVKMIRIENGAGHLVITGKSGSTTVSANGTVRADSQEVLNRVKLTVTRDGDVVTVRPDAPENHEAWGWCSYCEWTMDLTVEVPPNISLQVRDGSGGARISDVGALNVTAGSGGVHIDRVSGTVDLRSGSGGAEIHDVHGDVTARTGSGGITVEHVTGSVNIERVGSGGVSLRNVSGTAHVGSMGSGDLTADGIGGDLIVDHKGSGSVHYASVRGKVDVPTRHGSRDW